MNLFDRWSHAHPCVVLAVLALPAVYLPGVWPFEALALGLAALGTRGRPRQLVWAALGFVLFWGARLILAPDPGWPFEPRGEAEGRGTVVAEAPVSRSGATVFTLRVDELAQGDWAGRCRAPVRVVGWRGPSPPTGSQWAWKGAWIDPQTLRWGRGDLVGWEAPWWQGRAQTRGALTHALAPLGDGPAGLGEALLFGATDDLSPAEKDAFRKAGCAHVLALSGMHLSLLAVGLGALLRRRMPPWLAALGVQTLLGAFCFLAGPLPSLLRAWIMALLAEVWGLAKAPVPARELLAQSFLVTVALWPDLAPSLSLELSFLALVGLLWWAPRWERSLRPWVGGRLAAELGASAAAVACTAPLCLILFGEVRWIGLVAAPPLVILTNAHLAGTALAALAGLLGVDLRPVAPAFEALYQTIFAVAGWAAAFPALPGPWAWGALGLGALGAGGAFLYNLWSRRARLPVSLNYDSPASLQAFLESRGYNALKRWGQNFLINAGARKQILAALDLAPGEPVWEVGPGLGALTHHLVAEGHPLTVFEIDPGYAAFLRDEFGPAPSGFSLVEGDVLKTWRSAPRDARKCVGNLPYNAASAIVADFIEGGWFPDVFVVTVQLEMAERMTATPGNKNYSSFSVLCQSAFTLKDVVTLRPGSFYPAPEVTSRVVRLAAHGRYPGLDHRRFSTFVRECFSSRRKTLRNNLPGAASALHVSDDAMVQAFAASGIDLGLRAERLSVPEFVNVFQKLALPN